MGGFQCAAEEQAGLKRCSLLSMREPRTRAPTSLLPASLLRGGTQRSACAPPLSFFPFALHVSPSLLVIAPSPLCFVPVRLFCSPALVSSSLLSSLASRSSLLFSSPLLVVCSTAVFARGQPSLWKDLWIPSQTDRHSHARTKQAEQFKLILCSSDYRSRSRRACICESQFKCHTIES